MRMVSAVVMAGLLVLAGCSGDSGDDAAFEGDPIEGGTTTTSVAPDTTEPDEDSGSEGDEPGRVTLDPEALLEELMTATTLPSDDAAAPAISVPGPGGDAINSFRDGLQQAGLQGDPVDCFVASVSETLGMTEGEMDQLVVDDPTNGWLVAASQAAAAECLPASLPLGGSNGGIVFPADTSGTLTEQLTSLGLTSAETDCITALYADTTTATENKDFLACIPLSRLIELAG
jgi:hypothetical protein